MSSKKKPERDRFKGLKSFVVSEDKHHLSSLPGKKAKEKNLVKAKKLLGESPKNRKLLVQLMDAHFYLGNYREAFKYGKKALLYMPHMEGLRLKVAQVAQVQGKLKLANYILTEMDCSENSACLNLRAINAYKEKRFQLALKLWQDAKSLSPESEAIALNLASFYMQFYRPTLAIAALNSLPRQVKKSPNVKMLLSLLVTLPKKPDEAEDSLETLLEKDKYNPLLLHNLAVAYTKQKDWSDGLEAVKKALKYAPRYNFPIKETLHLEAEIKRLRKKDD